MVRIKRRDFMKLVGMAVACPTQLLNAKPNPPKAIYTEMIKAHGVTMEGSTIMILNPFYKKSMYLISGFIDSTA